MDIEKYKSDPVLYAEEVLGVKLFEYQKEILRKANKAKQEGKQLVIHYPYRNGRTIINSVWNQFIESK